MGRQRAHKNICSCKRAKMMKNNLPRNETMQAEHDAESTHCNVKITLISKNTLKQCLQSFCYYTLKSVRINILTAQFPDIFPIENGTHENAKRGTSEKNKRRTKEKNCEVVTYNNNVLLNLGEIVNCAVFECS